MKTRLHLILFILFITPLTILAQEQYEVELAAFNQPVSADYFAGIEGITYYADANDIHRYRIKNLKSLDAAKAQLTMAKSKGINARLISLERERELARLCASKLDHLFFAFDKYTLSSLSITKLDQLVRKLEIYPELNVVLEGHTDAKGSLEYNDQLSRKRVQMAVDYLKNRNVAPDRISTNFYGEQFPVAKNVRGESQDVPEGRKLNRRVEIKIVNTSEKKEVPELVRKINVPRSLKL